MAENRHEYLSQKRKQRRKRLRKRRTFTFVFLPILILAVSASLYTGFLYSKAHSVMDESYKPLNRETKREVEVNPDIDNVSILFVGIDDGGARDFKEGSRTDALMLATFNEEAKTVQLLSIPRDSYVYIPSKGYEDKINHAYGNGGIASTIETVEELLEIPVDYYVKMNFDAFMEVVDTLDGIKVDVPYEISEMDSNDRHNSINLTPGYQTLNGEEALALARTRKQDNDIERGKRQQEILKAVFKKAASAKTIPKYSDLMEAVGDNMETDLTFSEMKSFIDYAIVSKNLRIDTLTLDGYDSMIDAIYYYELDETALANVKLKLRTHLELDQTTEVDTEIYNDEE
ncbi:LCP family protein [Mesobacillus jeotgali]|uniref:LCP family protein n=1 Tax=Mesobacillus jeotgali TaxID=129985 RepID=UPI001CFF427E|nr:LCP family protein [Mesobacillus jeotgali]